FNRHFHIFARFCFQKSTIHVALPQPLIECDTASTIDGLQVLSKLLSSYFCLHYHVPACHFSLIKIFCNTGKETSEKGKKNFETA
ncbi:MAG TPA: hypothetical protein VFD44_06595, partial [Hanamia sp.]|nr:hypothetical protein [Hanamia sp.]